MMLLVAAALAANAWAQQPAPATPAAPAAAPATPAAPAAASTAEAPKAVAKAEPAKKAHKPNPHRQEDARHCLDKPTNTEIIKCAEAYL
jgi:hypothetical protein